MSGLAVDKDQVNRTAAVPSRPALHSFDRTEQPLGLGADEIITLVRDIYSVLLDGTLADRMKLLGDATSGHPQLVIQPPVSALSAIRPTHSTSEMGARSAITDIHDISQLTNEEIAPLVGVSRRSVQAWVAGGRISARKEQRLYALRDALREISDGEPQITRERLFRRLPGNVRPYDLLAEGRCAEAVDLALDRRPALPVAARARAHDLYAQLNHIEDHVELPPERVDRRFVGRLRR